MIKFVAKLSCDNPGCTATGEVGVSTAIESGCSPFGGPACKAELEADMHGAGWEDMGECRVFCAECWDEPGRFEPEAIAKAKVARIARFDWTRLDGSSHRCAVYKEMFTAIASGAVQYEATTDGGYPRVGWGDVCEFNVRVTWPYSYPVPSVYVTSWAGGSWHAIMSISEIRDKNARVPA